MAPLNPGKAVTVAHEKTVALKDDVRQAEEDLHATNETLAETVVGSIVTKESMEAALVQNLHVEGQLHDAVKELQVLTDLLKVAEQEKPAHDSDDVTMAGRRSGEGVNSLMKQMSASARRKLHR